MGSDMRGLVKMARAAMARLHMTQQELSRASGVNPSTVSEFLNGHRLPRLSTLAKLETALQLEPGSLANLEAPTPAPAPVTGLGLAAYSTRELLDEIASRVELLDELTARLGGRGSRA